MAFDARLTITGLCLLVTDHDQSPRRADLLLIDTSNEHGHHRHHPQMAFFTESQGNLRFNNRPALRGWEEHVIGPDGRAITRVDLENTIVRVEARFESEGAEFVRDGSMDLVPNLRRLGVTSINPPGEDERINGATSRVAFPPGTLFTSGTVRDHAGTPLRWRNVGEIAEFVHLHVQGLSELRINHGDNSFTLEPIQGRVEFGISNDPALRVPSTFAGDIVIPHFDMFERVADNRPMLIRDGPVTPGNPACPDAIWVQESFLFLSGGAQ